MKCHKFYKNLHFEVPTTQTSIIYLGDCFYALRYATICSAIVPAYRAGLSSHSKARRDNNRKSV